MLKNWLHIILSLWLINAVTFLQSGNPADSFNLTNAVPDYEESPKINSWADCILHTLADDDDATAEKAQKIKFQRRYVRSRTANDRVFIQAPSLSVFFRTFKSPLVHTVNKFFIGVAKLPAYYNFLFRLSPF
ncbi:hypothetical protein [Mucilaginibacter terrae]|uniref:Uncharacterized protein n=1 Tax=Mucilaginibacter terrae TaxID=1955052 RepID=A0ABU3GUE4_9SPHI|nr:hypothetical protein [Mucilaginibacter terrae]MDT3403397.1 hypothetical protein [Mucilaginibacter terrae]